MKQKMLKILKNESVNVDLAHHFVEIMLSETKLSSAGYPYLNEKSYKHLIENVPYLFKQGEEALAVLGKVEKLFLNSRFISDEAQFSSSSRALAVCRQVIFTANICAPTDLWILKNLLVNWTDLGIDVCAFPDELTASGLARQFDVKAERIEVDLNFLYCRGLLEKSSAGFKKSAFFFSHLENPSLKTLPKSLRGDIIDMIKRFVLGKATDEDFVREYFTVPSQQTHEQGWYADCLKTELGFRVVPLIVAIHQLKKNEQFKWGRTFFEVFSESNHHLLSLLKCLGYCDQSAKINELGERVFSRGPGPFGIIYAYYPYFLQPEVLYRDVKSRAWVSRSTNIEASQTANTKSFKQALAVLERFTNDTGFKYETFIEHAVGKGEATLQHWRSTLHHEYIQYIGADLEEDAIKSAQDAQSKGELPPQMLFLANADIGQPQILADFLRVHSPQAKHFVMLVGNGFHEVRQQTDEKMIQIFKAYHDLGIVLIFIEESGISDEDLRFTAWNTYHAGFKYVHEISGQGLRPVFDAENPQAEDRRLSWRSLASAGGYLVLDEYSLKTRTIYPYPRPDGKNPHISMTYFCLPSKLKPLLKAENNE